MKNSTLELLIKTIKSDKKENILRHIYWLTEENKCYLDTMCRVCTRYDFCVEQDNSDLEYVRDNIDELLFIRKLQGGTNVK